MANSSIYGSTPIDWAFSDISSLVAAGLADLQTGPFGTMLHASAYQQSGTPVIAVQHIRDNRIVHSDLPLVDVDTADRLDRYRVKEGDILFCRKGAVERCARVTQAEHDWLQGSDCIRLRLSGNVIDSRYLSYLFLTTAFRSWIVQHSSGATMPSLNQQIVGLIPILAPPLHEQRAIASILGALDDKIELNRKMNATLEAMARALFKSWFVDFDPVRAKAEGRDPGLPAEIAALFPHSFENSEGGSIPRGWRASTLGREASRCAGSVQTGPFGSQLHAADYITDGLPVVMPQDIQRRRVSTERISRIGSSDAGRLSRHRLQAGDLVYSRRGDVEKHALIGEREAGWICGTGCLLVRLGAGWPSPVFASIHLDMPDTRAWISRHAIGATMPNLNTGILSATPILVPPDPIIEAFAHLADPLNARSVLNDRESRTLAALRDALLPKLISGELRVGEAERVLAASA